jgi:methionine sulfoxide reductase heme-binding subunit
VTSTHVIWYVARGSAVAAEIALSFALVIGMLLGAGVKSPAWPMAASKHVHRAVAIAASCLIGLHIAAILADSFIHFSPLDAVVPFRAPYRGLWVGLGTIAFDALILLLVATALRRRMPYGVWRLLHRLAFPIWVLAVIHGLGAGTDAPAAWLQLITASCIAVVGAGFLMRLRFRPLAALGLAATGAVGVFALAGRVDHARAAPRPRITDRTYAVTARAVRTDGPSTAVLTIVGAGSRAAALAYRVDVVFHGGTATQALLQVAGTQLACRVPLTSYTARRMTALCGGRAVTLRLDAGRRSGTLDVSPGSGRRA